MYPREDMVKRLVLAATFAYLAAGCTAPAARPCRRRP